MIGICSPVIVMEPTKLQTINLLIWAAVLIFVRVSAKPQTNNNDNSPASYLSQFISQTYNSSTFAITQLISQAHNTSHSSITQLVSLWKIQVSQQRNITETDEWKPSETFESSTGMKILKVIGISLGAALISALLGPLALFIALHLIGFTVWGEFQMLNRR